VVGIAVFVAAVWAVTGGVPFNHTGTPAAPGAIPDTDYLIDLDTGKMTPLPEIIDILDGTGDLNGEYAVSPDGSKLAFIGPGDNNTPQVLVAYRDGTALQLLTSDYRGDGGPAWSPDGSTIAYSGRHYDDDSDNVFLVHRRHGSPTQVTHYRSTNVSSPSFSADGSSIVYGVNGEVRMVPILGGESVRLVSQGEDPQLSPDGSLLSYRCGDSRADRSDICLANADGTEARVLVVGNIPSAGSWSPDGKRIAFWEHEPGWPVSVVEVATGEVTLVAHGAFPRWFDDHTLIVEVDPCSRIHQCSG
jgi:Tol biopolymer transport system component